MNILIVDDSRTLRYVLIKTLHELGYKNVSAAASATFGRRGKIRRNTVQKSSVTARWIRRLTT